jgi:hypothetical protein
MKILSLALVTIALTACASVQTAVNKVENQIAVQAKTLSFADVDNAKLGAAAATDPAVKADLLACFNEYEAFVNGVIASTTPPAIVPTSGPTFDPTMPGFATLQVDIITAPDPATLLANIPKVPHQLVKDCSWIFVDAQTTLNNMGLSAGALGAVISAKVKVVPVPIP